MIAGVGVSGFAAADGLLQLGARVTVLDDAATEANTDKGALLEVLGATVRLGPGDGPPVRAVPGEPALRGGRRDGAVRR